MDSLRGPYYIDAMHQPLPLHPTPRWRRWLSVLFPVGFALLILAAIAAPFVLIAMIVFQGLFGGGVSW